MGGGRGGVLSPDIKKNEGKNNDKKEDKKKKEI